LGGTVVCSGQLKPTIKTIVFGLLVAGSSARAQSYIYDWSYSSPLYTGSGTLTVDPTMPQNGPSGVAAYTPVITGTFNGETITGLDNSGDYNNWLLFQNPTTGSYTLTYPNEPLWQVYEFAFTTTADEYVMNSNGDGGNPMVANELDTFDANNGGSGVFGSDDAFDSEGNFNPAGTFTITVVPEPSVNGLLAVAAILLPGSGIWRKLRARCA